MTERVPAVVGYSYVNEYGRTITCLRASEEFIAKAVAEQERRTDFTTEDWT